MPEQKSTTEQTFDMTGSFSTLLKWVQSEKSKSQVEGKPWGWIMAAIAALIVFGSLAFMAYSAWKKGREIAKLKHDKDLKEEQKHQAEVNLRLETEEKKQVVLRQEAQKLTQAIEKTRDQIKAIEKDRQKVNVVIDYITDWGGIDEYFKN